MAAHTSDLNIVITREFDAPRELFWRVWTEAGHIEKWFGPQGFSARVEELDFRVGGTYRYIMIGPDGAEYPSEGVFKEIVPQERIVSTDDFDEETRATGNVPVGMIVTQEFESLGDKTRLTVTIAHPTAEDRTKHEEMGVVEGYGSMLDCLEAHLVELARG